MEEPRKHQVSLRGASAREISRDALLEKLSQEREQRSYARRAASSAIFIQRVWRRYNVTRKLALQLQAEWESLVETGDSMMAKWVSNCLLRPFLFFVTCLSIRHRKIRPRDMNCMNHCLKILLESTSSTDLRKNFCSLAAGTYEERKTWTYQTKELIILCSFILAECENSPGRSQDIVILTLLALRLVVMLTDLKAWAIVTKNNLQSTTVAVSNLVSFMGTRQSGLYLSIRKYISKLDVSFSSKLNNIVRSDDRFFVTASAITLAVRPFNVLNFDLTLPSQCHAYYAAEQYCLFLLTIPWLSQRVSTVLLPALKHRSVLSPCMWTLLISRDKILTKMLDVDQSTVDQGTKVIPCVGWALANIIWLAAGSENDFINPGGLVQDMDYSIYVRTIILLAKSLLTLLDVGWNGKANKDPQCDIKTSAGYSGTISCESNATCGSIEMSYLDLYRPVCQQWHLKRLLASCGETDFADEVGIDSMGIEDYSRKLKLLDIAYFYSLMLRIFAAFNPGTGSLHVLNMLSFTPGFLNNLWGVLESSFFHGRVHTAEYNYSAESEVSVKKRGVDKKLKQASKDGVNKWVNVLHMFAGKSQYEAEYAGTVEEQQVEMGPHDVWDIEPLRHGPQAISSDMSCMLHLFSATYSHLLLVLDDIEFYEKQVPFTLGQQRRIASMLNTFVYNCLSDGIKQENTPLMDSATRCLHLMYERDCRHQFCPPVLWLSPARKSRPPIAVAARTHEVLSANMISDDASTVPSMGSVITTVPHVFPFEERVQMFREFINMDKTTRKMAGEVSGPGSRSVEIVVRRSHIIEDGFRQLNSLGSRLKSSIHVSFVSEYGLPEAGLDYGGLSKEFLTDISKAAFSPEYGLFTQTSTSDRLLMPNAAAKYLDNGIPMIEFLGRVVGKALYEGILLDYSFSHVFVQKLLGRYSFLDELSTLDPELYRNLMYVKHYDGDIKDLSLDFTITEESFGKRHIIELKPGGKDIGLTNENKMQYIHAMADYKLNRQILPFSNAFYRGLTDIISPSWLRLFNASEFNQLLSGGKHDIDVDDLRNNTRYTGGYSEGSRTIKLFWEVMKGFEPKERCMVLKFVTSCSRAPLLGFKYLQPSFTIHKVGGDAPLWAAIGGQDVERLPSASTCYNTLKDLNFLRPLSAAISEEELVNIKEELVQQNLRRAIQFVIERNGILVNRGTHWLLPAPKMDVAGADIQLVVELSLLSFLLQVE